MFSHVMMGSDDLERSRRFYDATMATLGAPPGEIDPWGRLVYSHGGMRLLLTRPIDGEAAAAANGGTIGFTVTSAAQGDAWHAAGRDAGGTAIEDPPGRREGPRGPVYLAYLRDPDGNKLCAIHRLDD